MDEDIKSILDEEYQEHPLKDLLLNYFLKFQWNEERMNYVRKQ